MLIRCSLLVLVGLFVAAPVWGEDAIDVIRCVQFSPNGRLAAFTSNNSVRLWDTTTKRKVGELKEHTDDVNAFVFAPDGRTLFTCSRDKTVRQWDLSNGKVLRQLDGSGSTDSVNSISLSADGKRLAAASAFGPVRVWETTTGRQVQLYKGDGDHVNFIALSPDGKMAASGGSENAIHLWSVETGKVHHKFAISGLDASEFVFVGLFSLDGKQLITAGSDQMVHVLDAATGKETRRCVGHQAGIHCAALSPDGRTLATGGRDATLRLWDLATGRELKTIECHALAVSAVAFSPDGRTLISGGYDCNVNLWEMATGKLRLGYKPDTSAAAKPPETLMPTQLDTLWKTLEGDDAAKAYDAVLMLSSRPQEAVPFLQKQLKASDLKIDVQKIQKWIKELDDDDFSTRENAQTELQKVGRSVLVPVQNALAKTKSVEMQRRLEEIVKALEKHDLPARSLRETRALEVLENANTPEAKKLLEALAGGTAEAELTVEAKATLARLSKRAR